MNKVELLVNPELESRIMTNMAPAVERAYQEHMTTGPRKLRNGVAELDLTAGTLDPLEEIYKAAKLEPQEIITTELVETVHESFDNHIDKFLDQGVDLRPAIRLAGQMNLGTENNLVWYHATQYEKYKNHPELVALLSRWTAEEADHGPTIELWGELSGSISPKEAHAIKMMLIMGGIGVATESFPAINAFTEPQEYDTGDAHRDLGLILDPIGRRTMNRIAGQEVRHGNMFGDIGDEIYSLDQETIEYALIIEAEVHRRFGMPAEKSYPNFIGDATRIAVHGLFTTEGVLQRQRERIDRLGLLNKIVTTEAAEKAQKKIAEVTDPKSRINSMRIRTVEQETEKYIIEEKAKGRVPVILGRTVIFEQGELKIIPEAA